MPEVGAVVISSKLLPGLAVTRKNASMGFSFQLEASPWPSQSMVMATNPLLASSREMKFWLSRPL